MGTTEILIGDTDNGHIDLSMNIAVKDRIKLFPFIPKFNGEAFKQQKISLTKIAPVRQTKRVKSQH